MQAVIAAAMTTAPRSAVSLESDAPAIGASGRE
jgi:hypothetical protein